MTAMLLVTVGFVTTPRVPLRRHEDPSTSTLAPTAGRADVGGVEYRADDIDASGDEAAHHALADELAEEILEAARAEEQGPPDASEYPRPLEIAASAGIASVVVALGYASWASGANIPWLWVFDFGIHEFGHLVTYWLPWQVTAAAGSVFQVAVPLGIAVYVLLGRGQWGGGAVLAAWAGCSARNVAVYIGDAPYQHLALWGGDGVLHDWAQLLQGVPMQYAGRIARGVDAAGWLLVALGFCFAVAPVAVRAVIAYRVRARAAAEEAYKATLPVRQPHGPVG